MHWYVIFLDAHGMQQCSTDSLRTYRSTLCLVDSLNATVGPPVDRYDCIECTLDCSLLACRMISNICLLTSQFGLLLLWMQLSFGQAQVSSLTFSPPTNTGASPTASGVGINDGKAYFRFETIPGFFLQDDPSTNPETFDYVCFIRYCDSGTVG